MKPRRSALSSRETLAGFLFVSPMLLGVSLLTLIPILIMLVLSFADWNIVMGMDPDNMKWVGFEHFRKLWDDSFFVRSLRNNMVYLLSVPIYLVISLLLAVAIDRIVYMKSYFKVVFFLPYISNIVAVATVWQVLFHPSKGPVNEILRTIGFATPPAWIADPTYALPSLMMISIWISIGFNMIVYMAGLQTIPKDLYEAAEIDGAGAWTRLRKITVPLLSPTTFFLLITGVIATFKIFDLVAVLTRGGPASSTTVLVWNIYFEAFEKLKVGYASSMGVILLLIVLFITLGQWAGQKKWVNY